MRRTDRQLHAHLWQMRGEPERDRTGRTVSHVLPAGRPGLTSPEDPGLADAAIQHREAGSQAAGASPGNGSHRFGDYELLEEIACGGMGVVYKARQLSLHRIVALKMILPGQLASGEVVRRFLVEAGAAAGLDHPNIVAIHEVGQHEGQHYFSMQFVEGRNLSQHLAHQPGGCPPREAARLLIGAARGVHHAHQRGILHRDLKPANIMVDAHGQPHVTDFGLAKEIEGNAGLTLAGRLIGTPSYMSPEQAEGVARLTTATDIYSLGAVLYHLLTGRAPFDGATPLEIMRKVVGEEPLPPSRSGFGAQTVKRRTRPEDAAATVPPPPEHGTPNKVDRDLETICLKCLEKEPARRYASADALADDLERWLRHEPTRARPICRREHVAKWVRRNPALARWAFAAFLVAILGVAGIVWQWRRADRNAAQEMRQRIRVEATVVRLEMEQVDSLFGQDRAGEAVAQLARLLRRQPDNRVVAERLLSALGVLDATEHPTALATNLAWPDGQGLLHGEPLALDFGSANDVPGRIGWAGFSPDGRRVLTTSSDFTVRVWDAWTGQALSQPMLHPDSVGLAHFSPDGLAIVTICADAAARLWDARTGEPLTPPLQHGDRVLDAQFSPDGRWIVTASADGTARVWETRTGQPAGRPLPHRPDPAANPEPAEIAVEFGENAEPEPSDVQMARFSPDGRHVATVCADGGVRIWDPTAGQLIAGPLGHQVQVTRLRFSAEGARLVTVCVDGTARVWDVGTGQPLTEPIHHLTGLATDSSGLSPDGSRVIILSRNTAQVRDLRTGKPVGNAMAQGARPVTAQFSPDGTRVAFGSVAGIARVWDAETALPVTEPLVHGGEVRYARFSPDGQWLLTASTDGKARLWEVAAAPGPVPRWLPGLAEAVVGQRIDENDVRGPVSLDQLANLQQQLNAGRGGDFYSRWTRWFFAPSDTRSLSPSSRITVPEYVQRRIEEDTLGSLREAVRLAPTNAVALARLGLANLRAQIEVLEREGKEAEALALTEGGLSTYADSVRLWHTRGAILERTGRPAEAGQAYAKALNLAGTNPELLALCQDLLRRQADSVWATRRVAEARAAFARLVDMACSTARECRDMGRQERYPPLLEGQTRRGLDDMWDLDRLLMLAERAVRLDPTDWRNFQLLGMAQYRNHAFPAAAEALRTEGRLRQGTLSARSLLYLAMTCRRLGDPDQALGYFAKADEWWQRNFSRLSSSRKAELEALRLEAETVLCGGVARSGTSQMTAAELRDKVASAEVTKLWRMTAQGKALANSNRLDEAIRVFDQAIALAGADTNAFEEVLREMRFGRSAALQEANRPAEAGVENCLARGIPLRDAHAPADLVDLSLFYNGSLTRDMQGIEIMPGIRNDLSDLPRGVQRVGPVEFDVRGLINLTGTFLSRSRMAGFPTAVTGIPLHRKLARLHVLHGTIWLVPQGTTVGSYVLRYADGQEQMFPIVYGVDVRDWQRHPTEDVRAERVVVAWQGSNPAVRLNRGETLLTLSTFENPRPEAEVASLDFISAMTDSAPFLIALTVE